MLLIYLVIELGFKEVCDELGIKLIVYSFLVLGILIGKYFEKGFFVLGIWGILFW